MSKILLLLASFLPLVSCRDMKKLNKMIVNTLFLQNLITKCCFLPVTDPKILH